MNNSRNSNNDAEVDNILAEFAGNDSDDEGILSLADKYQVDTAAAYDDFKSEKYRSRSFIDDNNPLRSREKKSEAEKKADEKLPHGHRLVYDDKALGMREEEKRSEKAAKPPVNTNGQRVIFDADANINNGVYSSKPSSQENAPRGEKKASFSANDDSFEDFSDNYEVTYNKKVKKKKKGNIFSRFLRSVFPVKGDDRRTVISKLSGFVFIAVLIGALVPIVQYAYEAYINTIIPKIEEVDPSGPDPRLDYPDIDFPEGLLDAHVRLYAGNTDFVGYLWLKGIGRSAEMSILQATDNKYYLKHDYFKKESTHGAPFLDANCRKNDGSMNSVIHGHNMKDGLQFAILEDYMKVEAFKANPTITYSTMFSVNKYKIYGVIITNDTPAHDNGYVFDYIMPDFPSEECLRDFLVVFDQKKLYTTGVDIEYGDRFLTLSTCLDNVYNNKKLTARIVLLARLLRGGEDESVDTSLAVVNPDPRYPQYWYDKKKTKNNYAIDPPRWYPNDYY